MFGDDLFGVTWETSLQHPKWHGTYQRVGGDRALGLPIFSKAGYTPPGTHPWPIFETEVKRLVQDDCPSSWISTVFVFGRPSWKGAGTRWFAEQKKTRFRWAELES